MEEIFSLDFDPLTKVLTKTGVEDGKLVIRKDQDLEPNIDYARALANDEQYTRDGIKKGWAHAIHLPETVIVELLQIGVDIYRCPVKDIVAGLHRLGKEHFITTRKHLWRA